MPFRGQHEHALDAKDRLTIPSKLRAQLDEGVVISASFDPCVEIHPAAGFDAYLARVQSNLNTLGGKPRMILRHISSRAQDEQLDSAGRVKLPKHLIEHGGLSGTCMVIGSETHLEVWSPERWAEQKARMDAEVGAFAEELAAGDWPTG